ncbi:MAG TPA: sugar phosphate isomerase/epimerase [Bryobacteraceae bacterium]|jgi:sugar phosphate isomerase/epimerase|nr:sugar phosphate isomerase/epimerase [Bryobacteraceae bacterium]
MTMMTSRRQFSRVVAATSLASAVEMFAETPEATVGDTGDFKLGVASYSFREFSRKIAIQGTQKLAKYINYKDVHLPLTSTPAEIKKAIAETEKAGLKIVGGGTIYFRTPDEADIRAKFEYAKACGMPTIVCMPDKAVLPKLEKFVKEYDIKIAVHAHGPEDPNFQRPQDVMVIVKNMDPRCGLCVDIGHTVRTGVDLISTVAEVGPRLLDLHVKDLADFKAKDSQRPCGDGIIPFPALFTQLKKMNYQGYINLEYEIDDTDPLPNMIKSFAYMRGVIAGLKG